MASWADGILAESDLPSDDFTWTEGSNYGLDGFHHDQTLGEGTRKNPDLAGRAGKGDITPAQTKGMSALPDGLLGGGGSKAADDMPSWVDEDASLDLSGMLSEDEGGLFLTAAEKEAASLADLAWLDPTQEQDPDRLPKELRPDQPPPDSISELEEAWGVNRRTDGLHIVPNKDKALADYEKSIESGAPAVPGAVKSADDAKWHIKKAIRRSHYGHSIQDIHRDLQAALGDTPLFKRAFAKIQEDHGVAGRVFIKASAFPGLRNGKWVDHLKKVCRTAKYVVTTDPLVAAKLGRQQVVKVPWRRALAHYKPLLQASNYRIASYKNPKLVLQYAFLTGPREVAPRVAAKPVHVAPSERVSTRAAKEALASAPKPVRQVISRDESAKARKKVLASVHKAASAGLLSKADALRLAQSKAAPALIRQAAERLARLNMAAKTGTYSGVGTKVHALQKHREAEWAKLAQDELNKGQLRKAHKHVLKMVNAGQITLAEGQRAAQEATAEKVLQVATAFANSSGTRKVKMASAKPAAEYAGPDLKAAVLFEGNTTPEISKGERALFAAAKSSGIRVAEFRALASWLRRQMSEGVAGNDLTALMQVRFASPLRKAASDIIASLRKEHEGLAGHLYVDAAAYASKKGTSGCDKGALKHRANQVPLVKAMERCGGCAFANANGVCSKYGKELMHELPADAGAFQRQMLAVADAPDHEVTASLFDPGEFGLSDNMSLDLEEPALTESLDGVVFGDGMTL